MTLNELLEDIEDLWDQRLVKLETRLLDRDDLDLNEIDARVKRAHRLKTDWLTEHRPMLARMLENGWRPDVMLESIRAQFSQEYV